MDEASFIELWSRESVRARNTLAAFSYGDAEDLLQDLFVKVYRRVRDGAEVNGGYIMQAARRLGIDHRRRRRFYREVPCGLGYGGPAVCEAPDDACYRAERLSYYESRVAPALASLPDTQRAAVLAFMDGEPIAETARRSGVVPTTIAYRLRRGLDRLRGAFDGA